MNDYSAFNRDRLRTLLADHGLDKPLDEHELALQLLDSELRYEGLEKRVAYVESVISRLRDSALIPGDPYF